MTMDEWDEALSDPNVDLSALATELGVATEEMERAARVREVLLAGRPPGGEVPDIDLNYLQAAGLGANELTAYVRVTDNLAS